jgi:DNA (cytosine-5)-methyltransferase 1
MAPLTYGSVCSGIEGASVAWAALGWRCAFMAEVEAFPRAVLKHHYPHVPLYSDFTHLRDDHAEVLVGADVLVGGTPCQGFSVAGLRGSLSDDRSNLCLEFIRLANAIDDLRRAAGRPPAWVLWENVPGVFSTEDNAFGAFLGGLVGSECALDAGPRGKWTDAGVAAGPQRMAAWRVLDAQHFGLAQRRRRVFVLAVGGAGAWRCADALLPLADSLSGHPAPRRQAGEGSARPIAGSSPASSGYRNDADTADNLIAGTLPATGGTARKHGQGWGQQEFEGGYAIPVLTSGLEGGDIARALNGCHTASGRHDISVDTFVAHSLRGQPNATHREDSDTYVAHSLRADGFDASEDGTGRGTPLVAPPLMARSSRGGGQTNSPGHQADAVVVTHALDAHSAGGATEDGTGRGVPLIAFTKNDGGGDLGEDISPTLRAGGFTSSHANGGVGPAIAFNWQNGGGYGEANDGLGITEEATGPLDASTIKAVAIPITADAARRGEGHALTPSPDAEGRVRLRDPGLGIGEDGDPAGTLQAAAPGAVFTLASRGRGDGHQLEFRDDELANAILTPSGGRAGIGVGAVAFQANGRDEVRLMGGDGDQAGSLAGESGVRRGTSTLLAEQQAFNITPSQGNVDYNARASDRTQALTGNGNRVSARGGDLVVNGNSTPEVSEAGLAFPLRADDGSGNRQVFADTAPTLAPGGGGNPGDVHRQKGNEAALVGASSAVRRLTPTECERLQGFPDGYTDVPFRSKPAADGPRYKALGNSFATPVIRWIGQRIQALEP